MKCIIDWSQRSQQITYLLTLKVKVNNISDSIKKVTIKIKEMARSVLHFALNIYSLSLSCFQNYFVTSVN
jgi:hypothetical protein